MDGTSLAGSFLLKNCSCGHPQSSCVSDTITARSSSRLRTAGGSGMRSSSLGTGQVVISSVSAFWNAPYLRMCFLLLSMKTNSWLLRGKFTSASTGMIHGPCVGHVWSFRFELLRRQNGQAANYPSPTICCELGHILVFALVVASASDNTTLEQYCLRSKRSELTSQGHGATGEKRSLDFSLVHVPLTESFPAETPALKTTPAHRKRAEA